MPSGTPYVTYDVLKREPLGVDWDTLGDTAEATESEIQAIVTQLCWEATYEADSILQQTMRATIDVDSFVVPNPGGYGRSSIDSQGVCRVITTRWPILSIQSGKVSPHASFPAQWTNIAASSFKLGPGLMPVAGSSVAGPGGAGGNYFYLAPGYVDWVMGRGGYDLQITYITGWPHAGLTADADIGATSLAVDDCTGFAVGGNTLATILDGELQEIVTVTGASATSGAGTLTLAAATENKHQKGTMVTTFPSDVIRAVALLAGSYAIDRGALTVTTQVMPGSADSGGADAAHDMKSEAEVILHPYSRVV